MSDIERYRDVEKRRAYMREYNHRYRALHKEYFRDYKRLHESLRGGISLDASLAKLRRLLYIFGAALDLSRGGSRFTEADTFRLAAARINYAYRGAQKRLARATAELKVG